VRCYPLTTNVHRAGILRRSVAPAPHTTPGVQQQAEALARRVLDELKYVGVLAIELFEVPGGAPPRPSEPQAARGPEGRGATAAVFDLTGDSD
jgi:hypothetical protein